MHHQKINLHEDEQRLVLLVDDEPDMLSMLQLVLEKKCKCKVITALSGLQALAMLEDLTFKFIVKYKGRSS